MPDRHAFLLEDAVVVIDPLPRLARIDEGEGQRADAAARRHLDGLAVGAGDPQRRVRLLQRLRHHVAARHLEELALEAGIGVHRHHVGALLDALVPHPPLLDRIEADIEAAELHHATRSRRCRIRRGRWRRDRASRCARRRAPGDCISAASGRCRGRAGSSWCAASRRREKSRARRSANIPRGNGARLPRRSRCRAGRRVRPGRAPPGTAVLVALVPRPRQLMLVENAEFHGRSREDF